MWGQSVSCPPACELEACGCGAYKRKCSLPTSLRALETHSCCCFGSIRTSISCLPACELEASGCSCGKWVLSGKVFPAPGYTLQACGCGYQDWCSLPTSLHITGLRLGISRQVFPTHQITHYRLAASATRQVTLPTRLYNVHTLEDRTSDLCLPNYT